MAGDRCDKCDKVNMITHIIFNPTTGRADEVFVSRKSSIGELIFCSYPCCQDYTKFCDECSQYRKGNNYSYTDKNDGKVFCSKECGLKYYAPFCFQCLSEKAKPNSLCCSERCKEIYYASTCDTCSKKCIKYDNGIPLQKVYYKDSKNKTGTLCEPCWERKWREENRENPNPPRESEESNRLSEIEKYQAELKKDKKTLAELENKPNRSPLEQAEIEILRGKTKNLENLIESLYKAEEKEKQKNNWIGKKGLIALVMFSVIGVVAWNYWNKKSSEKNPEKSEND